MHLFNVRAQISRVCYLIPFLLPQQIAAQPANVVEYNSSDLSRRLPPYPNRQRIEQAIVPGEPPVNCAVFTCQLGSTVQQAADRFDVFAPYLKDNDLVHVVDEAVWNRPDFAHNLVYFGTADQEKEFIRNTREVFATHAQGTVYLFMPYDVVPFARGVFWKCQWPILRDGGLVEKIVWVDANQLDTPGALPEKVEDITRIWWKKGDQQPAVVPAST